MMKKEIMISLMLLIFICAACTKWEDNNNQNLGEVVFTGKSSSYLKSNHSGDEKAEYAIIRINGTDYMRRLYYINEQPYTQSIKLNPGNYTVEQFLMYDDQQTPEDLSDDSLLFATPASGSKYAAFVNQSTPFDIEVEAFKKIEYTVEVLSFESAAWEEFGFDWFVIEQSVIREQCFFGDLCVGVPNEYTGSLYESQSNGLQVDMPAIAKIEVWQNTDKNPEQGFIKTGSFDNSEWFGEGQPLCVQYKDYVLYEDQFEFKLYVLVKTVNGFEYVRIHTWEFIDDEMIQSGSDGITDYVLGNCSPDADFIFPPYNDDPGSGSGTETAYAYTDGIVIPGGCFIELEIANNWGWQIGPFQSDYTFTIYAAAGQCNINNGTAVGELVVDFKNNNKLDVTYNMYAGFTLEEVHLWVGNSSWNGNNVAPGQFPYKDDDLNGLSTYDFINIQYDGGDIFLIAHAVVVGF